MTLRFLLKQPNSSLTVPSQYVSEDQADTNRRLAMVVIDHALAVTGEQLHIASHLAETRKTPIDLQRAPVRALQIVPQQQRQRMSLEQVDRLQVSVAKELIYTGRQLTAQEALANGLVNRVAPEDRLTDVCLELADDLCLAGPVALAQAKFAINKGMDVDLPTGLSIEANAYEAVIPTEDRLEGLKAFKEKRKPVYKGR